MLLTVDLERLELRPGDRLLDVGCGEGRHCAGARARGARVVGVDTDREALVRARDALCSEPSSPRSASLLRADALILPFRDASFDRVICSEVMEHVHDYRAAARELARVLRTGGSCAVTVPTALSEHLYLRLGDAYFETAGGHIRIFRPAELRRALVDAGLRPAGVSFAHGLHTPYWALRCLVGLERSERYRAVRLYRRFLLLATQSRFLSWIEKNALNTVLPKSLVIYTRRTERHGALHRR